MHLTTGHSQSVGRRTNKLVIPLDRNRAGLPQFWRHAVEIDSSLAVPRWAIQELAKREICATSYSRRLLFGAMARQTVALFYNHPLRKSMLRFFAPGIDLAHALRQLFGTRAKTKVKLGPSQKVAYKSIHDAIDIWQADRATMSANDVFYRDLRLDRGFDCEAIADFSVLRTAPRRLRDLEVATLLMGTTGCMSDSHSDDPDGCNHCVIGKKLWLVWDRRKGRQIGLEDSEYDTVYTRARFDIRTFLRLSSARWFVVSNGLTLFLPGHLTHKVITLEPYLGISNFYVGLVNALSSFTRWKLDGTSMVTQQDAAEIAELVMRKISTLRESGSLERWRWGHAFIREAVHEWHALCPPKRKAAMLSVPYFRSVLAALQAER